MPSGSVKRSTDGDRRHLDRRAGTGRSRRSQRQLLTVNADDHPLMGQSQKPQDDKRMAVILPEAQTLAASCKSAVTTSAR